MNFILNEYHRNIKQSDLIADLRAVAEKLNTSYVSRSKYEANGSFSGTPFISSFGSWKKALQAAGLETIPQKHSFVRISNGELLNDIKAIASAQNMSTITTSDYTKLGKYRIQTVLSRFNSWNEALLQAGLQETDFKKVYDIDLLREIENLWISLGRQPTTTDIRDGKSKYSLNTYARHFGGFRNALKTFVDWVNNDKDEMSASEVQNTERQDVEQKEKDILFSREDRQQRHITHRDINLRLRFKVMARDNFKCRICGASPAKDPSVELHIDHIVPWAKGGETIIDNLQTLCSKCNLGKSDLEIDQIGENSNVQNQS